MREDKPEGPPGHDCANCPEDGNCDVQDDFKILQRMIAGPRKFTMIPPRIDPRLMTEPPTGSVH